MEKLFVENRLVFQTPPQQGPAEQQAPSPPPVVEAPKPGMDTGANALPTSSEELAKKTKDDADKFVKARTGQLNALDLAKLDASDQKAIEGS
jgi:hypothetical protein